MSITPATTVFVAGRQGMVGAAIARQLRAQCHTDIVSVTLC